MTRAFAFEGKIKKPKVTWEHVTDVASFSEPGVEYQIKRSSEGVIGCACLAYRFKRGTPKTCKHIDALGLIKLTGRTAINVGEEVRVTTAKDTFTFKGRRAFSFGAPAEAHG